MLIRYSAKSGVCLTLGLEQQLMEYGQRLFLSAWTEGSFENRSVTEAAKETVSI